MEILDILQKDHEKSTVIHCKSAKGSVHFLRIPVAEDLSLPRHVFQCQIVCSIKSLSKDLSSLLSIGPK